MKIFRKLRAMWYIFISDQFKVYTYRFTRHVESEYMSADYATYTFSDNTDAVDRYIENFFKRKK